MSRKAFITPTVKGTVKRRTKHVQLVLQHCCKLTISVADVPPRETSPAARSVEKRLFSQASVIVDFGAKC